MNHSAVLAVPALALLIFAGCSAAAPATPTPAPTASPSPARPSGTPYHVNIPEMIRGTWQGTIQKSTVSAGLWTLEITNNEISATNPGPGADPFALGVTDITADHVTFYADQECQAGDLKEGTYTWALVNNELKFTLIQDNCQDRAALLTATAWQRKP